MRRLLAYATPECPCPCDFRMACSATGLASPGRPGFWVHAVSPCLVLASPPPPSSIAWTPAPFYTQRTRRNAVTAPAQQGDELTLPLLGGANHTDDFVLCLDVNSMKSVHGRRIQQASLVEAFPRSHGRFGSPRPCPWPSSRPSWPRSRRRGAGGRPLALAREVPTSHARRPCCSRAGAVSERAVRVPAPEVLPRGSRTLALVLAGAGEGDGGGRRAAGRRRRRSRGRGRR